MTRGLLSTCPGTLPQIIFIFGKPITPALSARGMPEAYTVENIVKGLTNLKLDLGKTLTDLSDRLIAETNKLSEIQQAIATETKNLEEIYDIKVAVETMATFIQTNEERKKPLP